MISCVNQVSKCPAHIYPNILILNSIPTMLPIIAPTVMLPIVTENNAHKSAQDGYDQFGQPVIDQYDV